MSKKEDSVKLNLGEDEESSSEESEEQEDDLEEEDDDEIESPVQIVKQPVEQIKEPVVNLKDTKQVVKQELSGKFVFADFNETIKVNGNKVAFEDNKTIFTKISESLYEQAMKGNQKLNAAQLDKLQNDYWLSREFEMRDRKSTGKKFTNFIDRNKEFREKKLAKLEEKKEKLEEEREALLENLVKGKEGEKRSIDEFNEDQRKYLQKVQDKLQKIKDEIEVKTKESLAEKPIINQNSKSIAEQKLAGTTDFHDRLFKETIGKVAMSAPEEKKRKTKSLKAVKKAVDRLTKNNKDEVIEKAKSKFKKEEIKTLSTDSTKRVLQSKLAKELQEVLVSVEENNLESLTTILTKLYFIRHYVGGEPKNKLAETELNLVKSFWKDIGEENLNKTNLALTITAVLGLLNGNGEEEDPLVKSMIELLAFEAELEIELTESKVKELKAKFHLFVYNRMQILTEIQKQKKEHKKTEILDQNEKQLSEIKFKIDNKTLENAENWRNKNSEIMKEYYKNQSLGDLGSDDDVPKSFFSPKGRLRVDLMYDIMRKKNDKSIIK